MGIKVTNEGTTWFESVKERSHRQSSVIQGQDEFSTADASCQKRFFYCQHAIQTGVLEYLK